MPLLLDERAVASVLNWADLIPLMRRTLAAFSTGGAVQPVRPVVPVARHGVLLAAMPGYLAEDDALGVKLVSVAPGNAARDLPTHLATIVLFDATTGMPQALLDGRLITEMRTAAVSAAAAVALASPGAGILTLIGTGVQAMSHLQAFAHVLPLREVRVAGRHEVHALRFAAEAEKIVRAPVRVIRAPEEAVAGADLIVTATSSHTPVLRGAWLSPGAHITAVGACTANARELDAEAIARARVFVDSRASAAAEAGDLLLAERDGAIERGHVAGEIGEVFAGKVTGRERADQVTVFESLGLAVEDVATARLVVERARAAGAGHEVHW
jgi:alanine dehydrogenase